MIQLLKSVLQNAALKSLSSAQCERHIPDAHLPWGSLTGIRPTRLLRELQHSCGPAEAKSMMLNDFDVRRKKFALAERDSFRSGTDFCFRAEKTMLMFYRHSVLPHTLPVLLFCFTAPHGKDGHVALSCRTEDGYCKRCANGSRTRAEYSCAVSRRRNAHRADRRRAARSFDFAEEAYNIAPGTEFTVEAGRPDTITAEKLRIIKQRGQRAYP